MPAAAFTKILQVCSVSVSAENLFNIGKQNVLNKAAQAPRRTLRSTPASVVLRLGATHFLCPLAYTAAQCKCIHIFIRRPHRENPVTILTSVRSQSCGGTPLVFRFSKQQTNKESAVVNGCIWRFEAKQVVMVVLAMRRLSVYAAPHVPHAARTIERATSKYHCSAQPPQHHAEAMLVNISRGLGGFQ